MIEEANLKLFFVHARPAMSIHKRSLEPIISLDAEWATGCIATKRKIREQKAMKPHYTFSLSLHQLKLDMPKFFIVKFMLFVAGLTVALYASAQMIRGAALANEAIKEHGSDKPDLTDFLLKKAPPHCLKSPPPTYPADQSERQALHLCRGYIEVTLGSALLTAASVDYKSLSEWLAPNREVPNLGPCGTTISVTVSGTHYQFSDAYLSFIEGDQAKALLAYSCNLVLSNDRSIEKTKAISTEFFSESVARGGSISKEAADEFLSSILVPYISVSHKLQSERNKIPYSLKSSEGCAGEKYNAAAAKLVVLDENAANYASSRGFPKEMVDMFLFAASEHKKYMGQFKC